MVKKAKPIHKIIWPFLLLAIIVLGWRFSRKPALFDQASPIENNSTVQNETNSPTENLDQGNVISQGDRRFVESLTNTSLPQKTSIKVPFLVQAPAGNWDPLHEDACEEASLIMIKHFLDKTTIKPARGDAEINDLIQFETQNGYGISITLQELAEIARSYYGLKSPRIETNITIDNIKQELAAGRPVIVGAAGKILPNPNFRNGGPVYHMLVVTGYNGNEFITNDPGTKKGENFRYKQDDLFRAIHNWQAENILNGEKALLVFD